MSDHLVCIKNPATGRVKEVTRAKADILVGRAAWTEVNGPDDGPAVVPPSQLPTTNTEQVAPAAPSPQRSGHKSGQDEKES